MSYLWCAIIPDMQYSKCNNGPTSRGWAVLIRDSFELHLQSRFGWDILRGFVWTKSAEPFEYVT
jgi:hypothetical protein